MVAAAQGGDPKNDSERHCVTVSSHVGELPIMCRPPSRSPNSPVLREPVHQFMCPLQVRRSFHRPVHLLLPSQRVVSPPEHPDAPCKLALPPTSPSPGVHGPACALDASPKPSRALDGNRILDAGGLRWWSRGEKVVGRGGGGGGTERKERYRRASRNFQ
eukprot:753790-Hanusia_phi.AAC.12